MNFRKPWPICYIVAIPAVIFNSSLYARQVAPVVKSERTTIMVDEGHASATFIQLPPDLKVQITSSEIVPDESKGNRIKATGSTIITIPLDTERSIIISGTDIELTKSPVIWSTNERIDTVRELRSMLAEDQSIRSKIESFEPGTKELRAAREEMISVDAANQKRLRLIIERFGWPGLSFVGEDGSMAAFMVLDHADKSYRERYMPLVREAARTGEISPSLAATLEDRNLTDQGKMQIYGTQFSVGEDGRKGSMQPINNPEGINMRRKKVGLPPLNALPSSK